MIKIKDNWHLPNHQEAARRSKAPVEYIDSFQIDGHQAQMGSGKTYHIFTYGCQANERDSETLSGILEAMNFTPAASVEQADVILLNTCGIRENASNTVLGELGSLKKLYRENKERVIGICGCMSQEEGFVETLLEKYPQVRLLFGTHNLQDLPSMLQSAMEGERVVQIYSREGEVYENLPSRRYMKHKAWVNIMYGCDKFCTYCIVPYTRGKQRSRTKEAILSEIQTLKKLGYKEVTLLGQNVNAYGKDLPNGTSFADILEETAKTGIERVGFMTSHPWDFSDEMIDVISRYDNIMPYIHLPLQSGDDEILARMGRRYSAQSYKALFDKIKAAVPRAAISTDIIVGFPNESDEAFEKTLDMVKACRFDTAFTFIYSPRPGTPAARMEDSIPMEVKKERLQRLNTLWNTLALENNQAYQDQVVEVLCDGPSKKDPNVYSGHTDTARLVNFTGHDLSAGDLVQVQIDQVKTFSLDGHQVD